VGIVANAASLDLDALVLENKGSSLLGWHLKQTSTLNLFHRRKLARDLDPWGVWQSEQSMAPSGTGCRVGR
jgi:hypothetical protein